MSGTRLRNVAFRVGRIGSRLEGLTYREGP